LLRTDHFVVLRSPDGEIGFSFDSKDVKMFFNFAKDISRPNFSLKLNLNGLSVQVNKEKASFAFLDASGKVALAFIAPTIKYGKKTSTPTFDWNANTSEFSISFAGVSFPASLVFGIGLQLPSVEFGKPGFSFGFGRKKGTTGGEDDSSESDEEGKSKEKKAGFKIGLPSVNLPSVSLPSFSFGGSWNKTLYGPKGDVGAISVSKGTNSSFSLPSFGFDFNLSHNGTAEFGASKWKLGLSPVGFTLEGGDLLRADHFTVLRAPAGEIGFSFEGKDGRMFFNFAKDLSKPNFSLKLNLSGLNIQLNKEKGSLGFLDASGKLTIAFVTPTIKHGKKNSYP